MDKAWNRIGNDYLTDYEVKKRILSYKDPEPDEKLPVRDGCCICLRRINSWFHGSGRTCSPECAFIYEKIFGNGNEVKKWTNIRDEIREARKLMNDTDSNSTKGREI